MTNSKAPWLTRGGAIALMAAAGIALAACSGGGGLNEDEAAGLQQELEAAQLQATTDAAARVTAEAKAVAAQAAKVTAEAEAEVARTAQVAAVAAQKLAEEIAAGKVSDAEADVETAQKVAKDALVAKAKAEAALIVAQDKQKKAEDERDVAIAAEKEALRLLGLAQQATTAEARRRQQAETDRERSEQQREDTQQLLNQGQAKYAHDGLAVFAGDTRMLGTHSSPPAGTPLTDVDPMYAAKAEVTTDPSVTFRNSQLTRSGRWAVTTFSNVGSPHDDDLVIYADMGAPTPVRITQHPTHMGNFNPVTGNVNQIRASLSTGTSPVPIAAPGQFPGGGRSKTFVPTIDSDPLVDADGDGIKTNDLDTTRFGGSFQGARGTFECIGTCTIRHRGGDQYEVVTNNWTFTTGATASVQEPDASYMYFGWWRRMEHEHESFSYATFSGGMHAAASGSGFDALVGSATYNGTAAGQYAIYQPADSDSGTGSFTATARLDADFDTNMLSGEVTNFSNASNWSLTLNKQLMTGGNVSRGGSVNWTIAGNAESGGEWEAEFFSDIDPYAGHIPEGVAGQFEAQFNTVGRLIGAFGAHCPTSTCPRR